LGKDCEVTMALQGNPFEKRLSGKGPVINRQPKNYPPLNPWDDPEPKKKEEAIPTVVEAASINHPENSSVIIPSLPSSTKNISESPLNQNIENPIITNTNDLIDKLKSTESTLTESQSTKNTLTNSKITKINRTERQLTNNKSSKVKSTKSQSTNQQERSPARNKRATPKLTRSQLTKSTLTESQSTQLSGTYSKNQGRWMLPEHDVLDLLAMTDKTHKLTGNQWPVFLFMSLKAYEYDKSKGSRGTGIRRFAGSFLSMGLGLSPSTCNDAINELIAKGYVELLEKNNYGGNLYKISPILLYRPDPNQVDRKSVNVTPVNLNSDRNIAESQSGTSPKVSQDVDRKSDTLIDGFRFIDSLSLKKFLTLTQLSELEARWLSFMKKEREREEKGLLKLIQQKSEEAELIFKAFQIILKEQDEYGEIKSAIAVLETNYTAQYRAKALTAIARQQQKEKENQTSAETKTQQQEDQDAEAKTQLIRMQCFQEAFPNMDTRKEYILTICKGNPMFSNFGFNSPIAISYAVAQWAQGDGSEIILAALDKLSQN